MQKYPTTIGLEVHVHLKTKTKMFCGCELRFAAPPNSCVCPVCLGLPGALPVLNREAFLLGLRAVLAVSGTPSKSIKFDRKNYFYPDLPKGYQISQFDAPLGRGGTVEIQTPAGEKKIHLNRIHLEEDAGKLLHDQSPDTSLVDLNRAGTPLIEIVTEPVLETSQEAHEYLTQLKAILKGIGVSDCDMEKGQLRCDANISIRRNAADALGTKVEIKNLNSFKAVKAALEYEQLRQAKSLDTDEKISQETRLWDDARQKTNPMRLKEEAHDYRYFPEPDLVPFFVTDEEIASERGLIPQLPRAKKEKYIKEMRLSDEQAQIISQDSVIGDVFEKVVKDHGIEPKAAANLILNSIAGVLSANNVSFCEAKLDADKIAKLQKLIEAGKISLLAATSGGIIESVFIRKEAEPEEAASKKGLIQVSDDSTLDAWIAEVIQSNPKVAEDFKSGKEASAMFLVGQVMKKSKGKANPAKVQEIVRKRLKEI